MNKTYANKIKRIPKDQITNNGKISATQTDNKKVENIFRYGKSTLKSLIQMFPKEARQYVRELDIPKSSHNAIDR